MGRCYQLAISLSGAVLITIVLAAAWATRKPSPVNSPIVVNTWAFTKATEKAWEVLTTSQSGSAALDSVEHVGLLSSLNFECLAVPQCFQCLT